MASTKISKTARTECLALAQTAKRLIQESGESPAVADLRTLEGLLESIMEHPGCDDETEEWAMDYHVEVFSRLEDPEF